MEERLQKILARVGYGSRRSCEELITAGRVRVNGKAVGLGDKADASRDKITVDGRPVEAAEKLVYVALYKPRGVISSVTDPELRPAVRDLIPVEGTLYPVGRLDYDSEGLILMTNDGDLANKLTHPRYEHEKEYRVLVAKHPDQEQLATWRRGVVLEDGFRTSPADVYVVSKYGKGAWLNVTLKEGHKRQIREMGKQTGLSVVRIVRVRIGDLRLGSLQPREWRYLTVQEIEALKQPALAKRKRANPPRSKPKTGR
ncbi:MAG TPA: pseudouridine synthase [Anaerolineales bacterium]|nr:pseudouridine synthase [Anaerolineales bacterium]